MSCRYHVLYAFFLLTFTTGNITCEHSKGDGFWIGLSIEKSEENVQCKIVYKRKSIISLPYFKVNNMFFSTVGFKCT